MRSRKVRTQSSRTISAITEYSFQLRVCLPFISSYFSVFNSSTTSPDQLYTSQVSCNGFRIILKEKITFKVVISGQEFLTGCNEFWGVSNLRSRSELLAFWHSGALLPSTALESFWKLSKNWLLTCLQPRKSVGIPVQLSAEERIATTTNEKARLLDLVNGSSLPDPSILWKRLS